MSDLVRHIVKRVLGSGAPAGDDYRFQNDDDYLFQDGTDYLFN